MNRIFVAALHKSSGITLLLNSEAHTLPLLGNEHWNGMLISYVMCLGCLGLLAGVNSSLSCMAKYTVLDCCPFCMMEKSLIWWTAI